MSNPSRQSDPAGNSADAANKIRGTSPPYWDEILPALATPREAASYLRTTAAKLAQDRYLGIGPTYVKIRGRILYPRAELEQYVDDHKVVPRSQNFD